MTMCFPSIAPIQCGYCHLCSKFDAISNHSLAVEGILIYKDCIFFVTALQTSTTIYEIAAFEIRNWKASDLYVSPVAKNRKVSVSLSLGLTTGFQPLICLGVISHSMNFNS